MVFNGSVRAASAEWWKRACCSTDGRMEVGVPCGLQWPGKWVVWAHVRQPIE